jgi:hypothetical protein
MTPEEHNKFLGIANLVYGGFHVLMMLFVFAFMAIIIGMSNGPGQGPPVAFFLPLMVVIVVFQSIFSVPSFVSGYALLKRKPWARVAAIISGVVSAMSFPVGTTVCVYTFWFLFSEPGKVLYDKSVAALPPPPPNDWTTVNAQQKPYEYVPPPTPPDWR